jgi:hypothetical protein
MASNDQELRIKVIVDSAGAVKSFQVLADEIDNANPQNNGADSGFSSFASTLITLNQGTQLVSSAFSSFASVATQLGETLSRGFEVDGLTRSFENLQTSIGVTANESLGGLREATKGMISDFELMQQANQAVLLGVDDGSGKFNELAAAAVSLGQATGRDAVSALSDLNTAIGRSSVLVADNLGIQVDAASAQRNLAASLGITVDALTEEQKSKAVSVEIANQAIVKARELAGVQEDAGSAYQALSATISNVTDQFSAAISSNENLGEAFRTLQEVISEIDFVALTDGLANLISQFVNAGSAALRFANNLSQNFSNVTMNGYVNQMALLGNGGEDAMRKILAGTRHLKPTRDNLDKVRVAFGELHQAMLKSSRAGESDFQRGFDVALKALLAFEGEVVFAEKQLKAFVEAGTGKGGGAATGGIPKLTKEFKELEKAIKDLANSEQVDELGSSFQAIYDFNVNSGGDVNSAFTKIVDALKKAGVEAGVLKDAINQVGKEAENTGDAIEFELGKNLFDAVELGLSGNFEGLGTKLAGIINDELDLGLSDELVGTIGGVFGNIANAFASSDEAGIGALIGAGLGAIIGSFFAGVGVAYGALIGSAIGGALGDASVNWFQSSNESTKAKKAADRYFAEVFTAERLRIIINGQITEAFDLAFRDLPDWFVADNVFNLDDLENLGDDVPSIQLEYLESLPAHVQQIFNAVGAAFDAFIQTTEPIPDIISQALAINLQGDLFNLKLAFDATGVSVEELGEALQQAALDGRISFLEAQGAINDIQILAEDGIPGAIGAVGEAFTKMKQAGVLGGRTTVAALQAIAAEAKEIGINDLPALKQALLDAGASEADVELLIGAMEKFGLSIDDVINANKEDLIPLLAELENQGFAFAESAAESVDELNRRLDEIPKNLETEWRVRVSTEATDSGAEQFLEEGGGRAL